jgi:hypothetical protein
MDVKPAEQSGNEFIKMNDIIYEKCTCLGLYRNKKLIMLALSDLMKSRIIGTQSIFVFEIIEIN